MPELSFDEWRKKVDALLLKHTELGLDDYPDWLMYDCWSGGASPNEGAVECLEQSDYAADALGEFYQTIVDEIKKDS